MSRFGLYFGRVNCMNILLYHSIQLDHLPQSDIYSVCTLYDKVGVLSQLKHTSNDIVRMFSVTRTQKGLGYNSLAVTSHPSSLHNSKLKTQV